MAYRFIAGLNPLIGQSPFSCPNLRPPQTRQRLWRGFVPDRGYARFRLATLHADGRPNQPAWPQLPWEAGFMTSSPTRVN